MNAIIRDWVSGAPSIAVAFSPFADQADSGEISGVKSCPRPKASLAIQLFWEWYNWRQGIIAQSQPNAGHVALVELDLLGDFWSEGVPNWQAACEFRDVKLHLYGKMDPRREEKWAI